MTIEMTIENRPRTSLVRRLGEALGHVSQKQWCFFLGLNALRALFWPYAGITHDARLYAVQVMNRTTGGFFGQDLFFLCGSQDGYSIFSILLAPLAAALGIELSFFLVYAASTALLIFAEIRLVRCLVPDRLAANIALVLLAVTDLPFAGWGVFHVQEPFLTARLPAIAVALLGLEQLLRTRFTSALVLLLLATLIHPLMGIGALLVALAFAGVTRLPPKVVRTITITAVLGTAVALLYQPLGVRLFGYVDSRWFDIVRRRNPYSFPFNWQFGDWLRITYSLTVVAIATKYLHHEGKTIARLVILLGLAAVGGSVVVEVCPYALILKGQPYRALWLPQFLAVPLGILLMLRLWRTGTTGARLGAIFVFCFTGRLFLPKSFAFDSAASTLPVSLAAFCLFALIFWRRRLRSLEGVAVEIGWFCPAVLASLITTAGFLSLTNVFAIWMHQWGETGPLWMLSLVPWVSGHAIVALAAILLITGLWSATKHLGRTSFVAAMVWIGLVGAAFFFPNDLIYWYPFEKDRAHIRFVRQFLHEHTSDRDRTPLVYWPTEPTHLWFDVPASSFYSWAQSAGVAFNRATAIECQRRALLVRRFEIANLRGMCGSDVFEDYYSPFYQADFRERGPSREDLIALCKEEQLDFVVLPRAFGDLVAGTNGDVFVYDCRVIRAKQGKADEGHGLRIGGRSPTPLTAKYAISDSSPPLGGH